MILLFLAGCYAVLLPLGVGCWAWQGVQATFRRWVQPQVPEPLLAWFLGLALLTAGLEAWSLAAPIHTGAHLAAALLGGTGLLQPTGRQLLRLLRQQARQLHPTTRLLGLLLVSGALLISCLPPLNVDTGLYHAPALRWLEEEGVVPGLANVDIHLGYNPSWFVPEALFSWGRYLGSPLQVLNMVTFCLFGLYALGGLSALLHGRFRPADLLRVLLGAAMVVWLLPDLASLSPDPAAAILAFFLLLQGVLLPVPGGHAAQRLQPAHLAVLLLCVFALKIKLAVVPLLLLPAWWLYRARRGTAWPFWLRLGAAGALLLLPWLARNLVLSGYLVFPVAALDVFSFDWKFPAEEMRRHVTYIREFARNEEFYHEISISGKPMRFWLPLWWHRQSLHDKLLTLALPLLLTTMVPLALRQVRRRQLPQARSLGRVLLVALAGVAFWFVMAPSFRFGYGFLLAVLGLLCVPPLWAAARHHAPLVGRALVALLASCLLVLVASIEYRYFAVPQTLAPTEYTVLHQQVTEPADLAFIQSSYRYDAASQQFVLANLPAGRKARCVQLMARHQGMQFTKGLLHLPAYLWRPARYPEHAFEPFALGPVPMLRVAAEDVPWYAPFPFNARPRFCQARGPHLHDGFRARLVPNVRDWQYEARW